MPKLSGALKRQPQLPRFLCHMYQRLQQKRLNLVTGAGISIDAGVPSWFDLLERLASHSPEMKADLAEHRRAGLSPEYLGQIIYHRHRNTPLGDTDPILIEATINHGWARSIHNAIYQDVTGDIDEVVKKHPYLASLRDLARKVPLVINFNFDDILADAIGRQIEKNSAGWQFSVVSHPPLLGRPDHTTIYHVNGVLPRVSLKKRSPHLIFTEDSFADALARAPGVSAEYIFLRFVQNTMLIIGHSLTDASLKNYLRRNRDKSPANHHYMIYWMEKNNSLTADQRSDIFNANLELYNVITIFLTSAQIREVLHLLNLENRNFVDTLDGLGKDKRSVYYYYLAGPVASGKSTVLEHLRCFETTEEWTRPPPPEMYLAFNQLNAKDSEKVDTFVYSELKEKNRRMYDTGVGIHFMDRAPLDLYAFSKNDAERKAKTKKLKARVTRHKQLQAGEIVFIWAKGDTLVERNLCRGRLPKDSGTAEYFTGQADYLKNLYEPKLVVATDDQPSGEVAKKIARHALFGKYTPVDLGRIMKDYS